MFPVTITYTSSDWRFFWRPLEGGSVKIAAVDPDDGQGIFPDQWSYQMDPPDTVNLGKTDALGMYLDLPFMRVVDNFRKACDEWVESYEEER